MFSVYHILYVTSSLMLMYIISYMLHRNDEPGSFSNALSADHRQLSKATTFPYRLQDDQNFPHMFCHEAHSIRLNKKRKPKK